VKQRKKKVVGRKSKEGRTVGKEEFYRCMVMKWLSKDERDGTKTKARKREDGRKSTIICGGNLYAHNKQTNSSPIFIP